MIPLLITIILLLILIITTVLSLHLKIDNMGTTFDEMEAAMGRMDTAITEIGNDIAALKTTVTSAGLTPEQEAAILLHANAIADKLQRVATENAPAVAAG